MFEQERNSRNNISFWFPKIENCGMNIPKTLIHELPEEIIKACCMDNVEKDTDTVYDYVKKEIYPLLKDFPTLLFIKNGTCSFKFDFKNCAVRKSPLEIANSIININNFALMAGAGGVTEIAIRSRIPYYSNMTPRIYNGLPLHNEYRVFYDFDKHKALYVVNYWNQDFCQDMISKDMSDKIIYEKAYPFLCKHYNDNKDNVVSEVEKHLSSVDLNGIWSVDILEDEVHDLYLIDMALAENSAYWNPKYAN